MAVNCARAPAPKDTITMPNSREVVLDIFDPLEFRDQCTPPGQTASRWRLHSRAPNNPGGPFKPDVGLSGFAFDRRVKMICRGCPMSLGWGTWAPQRERPLLLLLSSRPERRGPPPNPNPKPSPARTHHQSVSSRAAKRRGICG